MSRPLLPRHADNSRGSAPGCVARRHFRKLKSFALKSGTESTELEQQLNEERFRDLPATETADPPRALPFSSCLWVRLPNLSPPRAFVHLLICKPLHEEKVFCSPIPQSW